jgi:electron transfer flavoprotein-quinone oxidoreductase
MEEMNILDQKFDVAVVGAGPAGLAAAYYLAKKGFKTVVLERGREIGSKSIYGGRIYAAPLKEIYPNFNSMPVHRWVKKERISIMPDYESMISIDYQGKDAISFTAYLTEVVKWMGIQAETAGATIITDVPVTNFYRENNKVAGVVSGEDVLRSDVVVDAEGVNRLVLEASGIVKPLKPELVALGVKEVLKGDSKQIEDAFGLSQDEGLAWVFLGAATANVPGGAFLYTNRDSVSLGVVVLLDKAIANVKDHISQLVESLRTAPALKNYLKNLRISEYSAHLIPEDVWSLRPERLVYDGLLITGDAAGLLLNAGYTYRGVDFAAYSGYLAGKAIESAHAQGDYGAGALSSYEKMLKDSIVIKELNRFRKVHEIMKNNLLFEKYPKIMSGVMKRMFENPDGPSKAWDAINEACKENQYSMLKLLINGYKIVRAL